MDLDPIDLKYAKETADFIGADHTEVTMTRRQVLDSLEEVIALLGTYDITTIRASMGMYLCCKAIHEQTDVRVLMTGEISDELFGYKYTDFAPSAEAFQQEAKKRVDELYMYDVLRADRCISVNSLEARVPFGDLDFVKYVMSIRPELKMNTYDMGKYLLRKAFADEHPEALKAFLKEYASSAEYAVNSPADAGALVEKYGIMASAALAEKAIPNCNIVCITGEEMQVMVSGMLKVLFDANPKSVGGKLPSDDMFYVG